MNPYQDFSNQPQPTVPQPNAPMFGAPHQTPTPQDTHLLMPKKSKLPLILAVVAAVELLIIAGLLVVVANSKTPPATKAATNTNQSLAPQPATSVSVQQTNDAISQSLSSLSNDRDLPTDKLSDKNLGL